MTIGAWLEAVSTRLATYDAIEVGGPANTLAVADIHGHSIADLRRLLALVQELRDALALAGAPTWTGKWEDNLDTEPVSVLDGVAGTRGG